MLRRWSTTTESLLAGVLLTILLAGIASLVVDLSEVVEAITEANLFVLAWASVLALAADIVGGMGWWVLLSRYRISPIRAALINVSAIGLNHLSPVRIVGEPVQYGLVVMHDKLPGGNIIGSIALHRLLDLAVLAAVVGGGMLFLPQFDAPPRVIIAGMFVIPLLLAGFFVLGRHIHRAPLIGRMAIARQFGQYAEALGKDFRNTAGALALLTAYRAGIGLAGWTIAIAMDLDIGVAEAMVVTLAALFLSVNIPGFVGGIGVFEAAVVVLLDGFAVQTETALAFAVLLHAALLLPPLLTAVLFLPREGVRSMGAIQEMIDRWRERRAQGGAGS